MSRTAIEMRDETRIAAAILGSLIRRARKGRGMTVDEAAQLVGVSPKTLRRIEHGTGTSTLAHVFNAAAAFDIALFDAAPEQLQTIYEDMAAEGLIPAERQRVGV